MEQGKSVSGEAALCVDLDGTLLKTDILAESLLALLARKPHLLALLPIWLLRGKSYLKHQIALRVHLDPRLLPYNEEFLSYLRSEAQNGRSMILATASHFKPARAVAQHLGFFQEVLASDEKVNLRGREKSRVLVEKFGQRQFDYAGNAKADIDVWRKARKAILVNPEPGVEATLGRESVPITRVFKSTKKSRIRYYLKALRAHQWAKNVLVFVPLVAAHKFLELDLLAKAVTAFIAFSLCASSGYIFNDLLDLPFDRAHPRKRFRPIAAGELSILKAVALGLLLLLGSFVIGSFLAIGFLLVLCTYLGLVLAYSLTLRQKPLLDVFTLAVLYTLRHFAGAQATATPVSLWLLALSMFMFLSLALVKRCTELQLLEERQETKARDREYVVSDFQFLQSMGLASGYVSVLVLALYVNSDAVVPLYSRPWLLWATCPLVLYWISRLWWKVIRNEMHDDPLIFALTDKTSLLTGTLAGVIMLLAM